MSLDDLQRIGRRHQDLSQQLVGIECDRRQHLIELRLGVAGRLGALRRRLILRSSRGPRERWGWRGRSGFAGNGLHGAAAERTRRKLGGSRFGGEKGQRLSAPSKPRQRRHGRHAGPCTPLPAQVLGGLRRTLRKPPALRWGGPAEGWGTLRFGHVGETHRGARERNDESLAAPAGRL